MCSRIFDVCVAVCCVCAHVRPGVCVGFQYALCFSCACNCAEVPAADRAWRVNGLLGFAVLGLESGSCWRLPTWQHPHHVCTALSLAVAPCPASQHGWGGGRGASVGEAAGRVSPAARARGCCCLER
jgi:hypothetical protein